MSHWPFIIAAYGITLFGAIGVSWMSWRRMRAAERRAEALKDRQ